MFNKKKDNLIVDVTGMTEEEARIALDDEYNERKRIKTAIVVGAVVAGTVTVYLTKRFTPTIKDIVDKLMIDDLGRESTYLDVTAKKFDQLMKDEGELGIKDYLGDGGKWYLMIPETIPEGYKTFDEIIVDMSTGQYEEV